LVVPGYGIRENDLKEVIKVKKVNIGSFRNAPKEALETLQSNLIGGRGKRKKKRRKEEKNKEKKGEKKK